jgi:hypothetical protein
LLQSVGEPALSGAAVLQESVVEQEKSKARSMVALFDRGAFKIDHPYERTAPLYKSLVATREDLQKSGASALLLHDVSILFGEIVDILQDVHNKINVLYPEVEIAADKSGRLTRQDDDWLRSTMGQRYYDAANMMMSIRPQVEERLDAIREHLGLKRR